MTHPTVPTCHWCDRYHLPLPETGFTCRNCGFQASPHEFKEVSVTIETPKPNETWPELLKRRAEELPGYMLNPNATHEEWARKREERRQLRRTARRLRCMDGGGI